MLGPGLRAAQVVLLGVCALLVYAILAPHLDAAPALRDVQHADVAAAPDAVGLGHYASIWKRSPFRKAEKVTVDLPKPKALKVATVSKLSWEVVATAAASSPEFSVAGLVNAKSGERRTVRVGDEVDGRSVVEIERRRVIFDHAGKLEQLEIAEPSQKKRARSKQARAVSRRAGARPVRPRLGKSRGRTPTLAAPATPAQKAPSAEQLAGQFGGQLDLAEGERIVSVNGLALDDPALARAANEGGAIVVQIESASGESREVPVGPIE